MARRRSYSRRRSRGGKGFNFMGMGPIVIIIGVIILAIAAFLIMKKLKGKGAPAGPSLDTIVANQQKAVQQAHAARLTNASGCSSCGGH